MTDKKPFEDKYGLFDFNPDHTPLERALGIAVTLLDHFAQPKPNFSREAYYEAQMEISYQWNKHLQEMGRQDRDPIPYTRRQMEREKQNAKRNTDICGND